MFEQNKSAFLASGTKGIYGMKCNDPIPASNLAQSSTKGIYEMKYNLAQPIKGQASKTEGIDEMRCNKPIPTLIDQASNIISKKKFKIQKYTNLYLGLDQTHTVREGYCEYGQKVFIDEKKSKIFVEKKPLIFYEYDEEPKRNTVFEEILSRFLRQSMNYRTYENPIPPVLFSVQIKIKPKNPKIETNEQSVFNPEFWKEFKKAIMNFQLDRFEMHIVPTLKTNHSYQNFKEFLNKLWKDFESEFERFRSTMEREESNSEEIKKILNEIFDDSIKVFFNSEEIYLMKNQLDVLLLIMAEVLDQIEKALETENDDITAAETKILNYLNKEKFSLKLLEAEIIRNTDLKTAIRDKFEEFNFKKFCSVVKNRGVNGYPDFSEKITIPKNENESELKTEQSSFTQRFSEEIKISEEDFKAYLKLPHISKKEPESEGSEEFRIIRKCHFWYAVKEGYRSYEEVHGRNNDPKLAARIFIYKFYLNKANILAATDKGSHFQEGPKALKDLAVESVPSKINKSEQEFILVYSNFAKDCQDLFEKMADGDIQNLILWKRLNFLENVSYTSIHPIIAGIGGYYDKLKSYQKNEKEKEPEQSSKKKEYFYTDDNLPKITFINLDGFDHPVNYAVARGLGRHLQVISITVDHREEELNQIERIMLNYNKTKVKKHFYSLPMRISKGNNENQFKINSKDFWHVFNTVVFKLIASFNPSLIVLSHSFSFYKTINGDRNLSLSPETFGKIIKRLLLISNYKVVLFPNIVVKDKMPRDYYRGEFDRCKEKAAFENEETLFKNRKYIYEMIGAYINAVNGKLFWLFYLSLLFLGLIPEISDVGSINYSSKNHEFLRFFNNQIYPKKFLKKSLLSDIPMKNLDHPMKSRYHQKLADPAHPLQKKKVPVNYLLNTIHVRGQGENIIKKKLILATDSKNMEKKEKINFYYQENTTVYIHSTSQKKLVFFINVWNSDGQVGNYWLNLEDKEIEGCHPVKSMPFYSEYSENEEKKQIPKFFLTDFSVCASSNYLYLIGGIIANNDEKKPKELASASNLNNEIFAFSLTPEISNNQWTRLKYPENQRLPITRIRTASCVFPKGNRDVIYVMGGTGFEDYDIYNQIDCFTVYKGEKLTHSLCPKGNFKNFKQNYRALNKSVLIPYKNPQKPDYDCMLLLGGTGSEYIVHPKGTLSLFNICIKEDKSGFNAEIESFNKDLKFLSKLDDEEKMEGLNIMLSQAHRQNYELSDAKKIDIWVSYFFPPNNKTIVLSDEKPKYSTKSFQLFENNKVFSNPKLLREQERNPHNIFLYSIPLGAYFQKVQDNQKKENQKQVILEKLFQEPAVVNFLCVKTFESFLKGYEIDFLLINEERVELMFVNFKDRKSKQNKDDFTLEDFKIAHLEFNFPELRNLKNYQYPDYTLSQTKMTKIWKCKDQILILVNSPKDNFNRREIFSFYLSSLDLKSTYRIEPVKIFSNETEIYGSSMLVESPTRIFLIGGKSLKDPLNELGNVNINLLVNPLENITIFVPNNLKTFINPYLFLLDGHLYCVDRTLSISRYYVYFERLKLSSFELEGKWERFYLLVHPEQIWGKEPAISKTIILERVTPMGRYEYDQEVFFIDFVNKNGKTHKLMCLDSKTLQKNKGKGNYYIPNRLEREEHYNRVKIESQECYFLINEVETENKADLPFFNSDMTAAIISDYKVENEESEYQETDQLHAL